MIEEWNGGAAASRTTGNATARSVELLEVVDVEHHERDLAAVATGAGQLTVERVAERPAIGELRQGVVGGQLAHLVQQPGVAQRKRAVRGEAVDRLHEPALD